MRRVSLLCSFIISFLFLEELKRTSFLSAEVCLSISFVSLAFDENTFDYFLHKTITTTEIVEEAKRVRSCCSTDGHDMNVSSFISLLWWWCRHFHSTHFVMCILISLMLCQWCLFPHLIYSEKKGEEKRRKEMRKNDKMVISLVCRLTGNAWLVSSLCFLPSCDASFCPKVLSMSLYALLYSVHLWVITMSFLLLSLRSVDEEAKSLEVCLCNGFFLSWKTMSFVTLILFIILNFCSVSLQLSGNQRDAEGMQEVCSCQHHSKIHRDE